MHKKINAILIPVIILGLAALLLVLPGKTFSERENRTLQSFPKFSIDSIVSGRFTEEFEDFVCDHFPARDMWIGINTRIKLASGQKEINGVYFAEDDYLIEKYEESDYLEKIAGIVNSFAGKVEADVVFMPVPTSSVINKDKLPEGADCADQLEAMKLFCSKLECRYIDLTDLLKDINGDTPSFYRLDHHWTSDAAREAYTEYYLEDAQTHADFDSILNKEVPIRATYVPAAYFDAGSRDGYPYGISQDMNTRLNTVSYTFRGTLFNKVGECGLGFDCIKAPDLSSYSLTYEYEEGEFDSIYDKSKLDTADKYAYFLSGNHPVANITNLGNEDVYDEDGQLLCHYDDILIIKDSYANSLIPFMVGNYHRITVVDPRYYGGSLSDLANELGAEHVLFVYNMNSLGTDLGIRRVR